ncbi:MAG: glycine-rich domain-containing protein, partial [Patescibacteria group bacterium]
MLGPYSSGVSPAGSPVTIVGATAPAINQTGFIWRNDDSAGSIAVAQNTALGSGVYVGDRKRLRFQIANTGGGPANGYNYRLEYAPGPGCTSWSAVPMGSAGSSPWVIEESPYLSNSSSSIHLSDISAPGGTFTSGLVNTLSNETNVTSIPAGSYSEFEYSLKSTLNAVPGTQYCFRLTNGGSTSTFTYTNIPRITLLGVTVKPVSGGSGGFIDNIINVFTAITGGTVAPGGGGGGGTVGTPSGSIETTTNTAPAVISPFVVASGGEVAIIGNYKIHTFRSGGVFTVASAPTNGTVEVLVVAGGGGGGGKNIAGGGGGGGVVYNSSYSVSSQTYPVVVGSGGFGGTNNNNGIAGNNSVFGTITAVGGGYGAHGVPTNSAWTGGNGGSGGGGGGTDSGPGSPGGSG